MPAIQVLVVAMVFRTVMNLAAQLFQAIEPPRLVFDVNAVRVVVLAVSIMPLLRLGGITGVAVSVLCSSVAGAVMCVMRARAHAASTRS